MGHLSEKLHSDNRIEGMALYNRLNPTSSFDSGVAIANGTLGLLGGLTSVFLSTRKGSDNQQGAGDSTAQRQEYLENRLAALTRQLGSSDVNELNNNLNAKFEEINTVSGLLQNLESINAQLQDCNISTDDGSMDVQRHELLTQKQKLEETINGRTVEQLTTEYKNMQRGIQEFMQVQEELNSIKTGNTEEKTNDMKAFTKALKAWQSAPDNNKQKYAQKAIQAYNDIQNKTTSINNLYELYNQDLERDSKV